MYAYVTGRALSRQADAGEWSVTRQETRRGAEAYHKRPRGRYARGGRGDRMTTRVAGQAKSSANYELPIACPATDRE